MQDQRGRQRALSDSLWRFSLALYARPGVADALLALQDCAGRDVNLILFALWVGVTEASRLDASALKMAEAAIGPLNAGLVHKLRRLRREIETVGDGRVQALRRRILGAELAAERQAQHHLAAAAIDLHRQPGTPPLAAAEANLAVYLGDEARSAEADVLRQAVAALMRASRS